MPIEIQQFSLGWHAIRGPAYRIQPVGKSWSDWIQVSSADLSALAAIFNEKPVYLHPDGAITTGPEPIGS